MFRRAATQLAAASKRFAAAGASSSSPCCAGSAASSSSPLSSGIGSIARSFASSSSSAPAAASAALSRSRVRPLPTLAWAAASALATTSLLSPSGSATKAEEAKEAAAAASSSSSIPGGSSESLYLLPAATGLFSSSTPPLTLYQYDVCPFCCKVKAVLDFYRIPYRVVEVSPLTKRQLKWGAHRKVPVLALGGTGGGGEQEAFAPLPGVDVLADSSLIISRIAAEADAAGLGPEGAAGSGEKGKRRGGSSSSWFRRAGSKTPSSPSSPRSKEAIWRKWVDGRLVKVITVNIYRTGKESWQTFDYISETGDFGGIVEKTAARVVGAGMMWMIAVRLAKKYGVEGEPRAALEHAGREWTEGALRRDDDDDESASSLSSSSTSTSTTATPFAGGVSPDLADLSAFGVWRAVSKTDSFADAMAGNGELRAWYERMERAVGPSSRVE